MAALTQCFVVIAESHKTLQAKICDILFPCGDQATKNRRQVGGGVKGFVVSKKRVGAQGEFEHEQDRGNERKFCKKQFEKKNFAKVAKILRLSR